MKSNERIKCLQIRLRNLKRKFAKLKEHADLSEESLEIKAEIEAIEKELNL